MTDIFDEIENIPKKDVFDTLENNSNTVYMEDAPPPSFTERSSVQAELESGSPIQELSDFAVFQGYQNTKGNKNIAELWKSFNPIQEMRGDPDQSKAYFGELQRRGWSQDLIKYATPPEQQSLKESIVNSVPQMILPNIASAVTLATTKNPYYAAGAAGIAGAANTAIGEFFNRKYNPAEARTATELSIAMGKNMLWEAGSDLVGGKIGQVAGKSFAPVDQSMLRSGAEASNELESAYIRAIKSMPEGEIPLRSGQFSQVGFGKPSARPLPSMVTKSKPAALMESLIEDTVGGGRLTQVKNEMLPVAWKQKTTEWADNFTDGLFSRLKTGQISESDIGDIVADELTGSKKAWRGIESRAHRMIDVQLEKIGLKDTAIVDVSNARKVAQEFLDTIAKGGSAGLGPENAAYIKNIAENPNFQLTFENAKSLNQELSDLSRRFKDANDYNSKRVVDSINKHLKNALVDTANSLGGDVKKAYNIAEQISAKGNELYKIRLVENLDKLVDYNSAANQVASRILSGEGILDDVQKILFSKTGKTSSRIAKNKQTWDFLTKAYLAESMVDVIKKNPDGILNPTEFYSRFNKIGQKAINKMYSKEQQDSIKFLVDMGRMATESPEKDQMFAFILRGMQAGAVKTLQVGGAATAYKMGGTPEALAVLFAPNLLARFVTSHTGNKLLTEGYQLMKTSGQPVGSFTGRYMSALLRNKLEYEKELDRHNALMATDSGLRRYEAYLGGDKKNYEAINR